MSASIQYPVSLITPVSKHITPENHIPQQAHVTPGSLTSPEPITSLTFKDPSLPTYDYFKQEDSSGLNVSNVDSNITEPDLTPGCFEIECVNGQGAKDEYNTGAQGPANQFEMWLEESLFLLVLYKGMKTKLGLRRGLQKNNKWPTCCCPS